MNLTDHFTLEEMVISEVAARKGLDNTPSDTVIANLTRVAQYLEQVRSAAKVAYGPDKVVIVTSGYRSPAVNEAVGGVSTSAHCKGLAADIHVPGVAVLDLARLIEAKLTGYDQLIHEFGAWVHVGLSEGAPRHMSLTIGGHPVTTRTGLLPL